MSDTLIVFLRELKSRVRSRAFVIGVIMMPLLVLVMIMLPRLGSGGGTREFVVVNEASVEVGDRFVEALGAAPKSDRDNRYELELRQARWDLVREELNSAVLASRIDGYVVVPRDFLERPVLHFRARSTAGTLVVRDLQSAGSRTRLAGHAQEIGIDAGRLRQMLLPITVQGARIDATGEKESSALSAVLSAYLVAFLIYMLIVMHGTSVAHSVLEEKTSRIAEVVLSSIPAGRFIAGKLFGVGGTAILQIALSVGIALVVAASPLAARLGLPAQPLAAISIEPSHTSILFACFLLGFLLYAAFFAIIGAAASNQQEVQSMAGLAQLPALVPLVLMLSITNDPTSPLAVTLSLIPFTAPVAIPMRLAAGPVPQLQIVIAMLLIVVSLVAVLWAAGKIYRIGALRTGSKASWAQLWRWVREPA
jgi:ABC-2 type transport system permease protein